VSRVESDSPERSGGVLSVIACLVLRAGMTDIEIELAMLRSATDTDRAQPPPGAASCFSLNTHSFDCFIKRSNTVVACLMPVCAAETVAASNMLSLNHISEEGNKISYDDPFSFQSNF